MKKILIALMVIALSSCKKEPTTFSITDEIGFAQNPEKIFGSTLPNYEDPYIIIYEYAQGNIVSEVKIDPVPHRERLTFNPDERTEYLVVCFKAHGWWDQVQRDEPQTRYINKVFHLSPNENTEITISEESSITGKNPAKQ